MDTVRVFQVTYGHNRYSRVKFCSKSTDPHGAKLRFFTSVATELRRNGVDHVINDATAGIFVQLSKLLESRLLWDMIASRMRYWAYD